MPNQVDDALLHAMYEYELSRVRTEFSQLRILPSGRRFTSRHVRVRAFPRSNRIQPTANIANCFATSSTTEHRVFWPWPLWQFFFPGASSGAYTDVASLGYTVRPLVLLPPVRSATRYCPAC